MMQVGFFFEKSIFTQNKKEKLIKFDKETDSYKFPDFLALGYIKSALENGDYETREIWKESYYQTNDNQKAPLNKNLEMSFWEEFLQIFLYEFNSLFTDTEKEKGYDFYKTQFSEIIKKDSNEFSLSPEEKLIIKNFADSTLWIYQMAKYFAIESKRKWLESEYPTDSHFYDNAEFGFKSKFYDDAYEKIVKLRILLQSYLTKKAFNTDKWKLNFENSTLVNGWDKNQESANSTVILRKDNRYYLAIMRKGNNKIFDDRNKSRFLESLESGKYEKMVYKQIADPTKDIHNLIFINGKTVCKKGRKDEDGVNRRLELIKEQYLPKEINEIRKKRSYSKGSELFNEKDANIFIDYYKERLIEYYKDSFVFSFRNSYKDFSDFSSHVSEQTYKIFFEDISESYINEKNQAGELFLFEIHNKDWNLKSKDGEKKTGNKNTHTIYFEHLFSEDNKNNNFPLKLNGEAELFYRPKTDENKLGIKKDSKGKTVINKKRYATNKAFLHVPITLNRTSSESRYYNQKVNEFLVKNPEINIIGIDRGEKHLIYYAGIDQKGNFLKDSEGKPVLGSLNEINGVNYAQKLEERAKGREKAKQDWQEIENIKDLKKGYISAVVRKLADLIVEHNAIIVFEDLNMRFKQIRGGIEKSVYQQLEKALIDKLNFLVNKGETDSTKAGHVLKAFQLTAPFTAFKDMGKQTGVIFYTQASYTSKTCPECGFRPNIKWEAHDIKNKIAEDKLNINYNLEFFEISYNLSDFIKAQNPSKRKNILYREISRKDNFVLTTQSDVRYKWYKRELSDKELQDGEKKLELQTEKGVMIEYSITNCLFGLLKNYDINPDRDVVEQIRTKQDLPMKFFERLAFYLYLLTNTRSAISGTDIDYINCPACDFHSENGFKNLKFNGDANGAYNIARKGIIILEKLKNYKQINSGLEKIGWSDLFIDVEEWDKFTQNNKLDV